MATHSGILAWKIPWTEEPGKLHSMGSQRVGHDWETEDSIEQYSRVEKPEINPDIIIWSSTRVPKPIKRKDNVFKKIAYEK